MVERPKRVQAAFEVFEGKPDTGPNAASLFEYIETLERQIAELRAKVARLDSELNISQMHETIGIERFQAAEAENARLKALPPKDEVERVLGKLVGYLDQCQEAYIENTSEKYFEEDSPLGKAINAARSILSRLQAGVQEGWLSELERKAKAYDACDWYWPEDDTSSEMCGESAQEIVQNAYDWTSEDVGHVIAVARGGVVEITYCASLPPAHDADSDDDFWIEEVTREAAQAKIDAEKVRRAALSEQKGERG